MNDHALDQEWTGETLLRFALPTMAMMLFMGLYTLVDTVFVARFVHTDALSAVNIVCPVINVTVGLGTMLAAGGNAVISRKLGAGREQEAGEDLALLTLAAAAIGLLIFAAGSWRLDDLVGLLGAGGRLAPYCRAYLGTLLFFFPANVVQTVFASLFVTAGRPGLGLGLSVLGGLSNIVLDYILIVPCGLGIRGAALGTGVGYLLPAAAGIFFFARNRGGLSFTRPKWRWKVLRESCLNGSSEMVGQLSAAVTTFLFNITMMELAGEDGVAAVTILIYAQFLLNTLYIGFSMGVAPVIGYHYGSQNAARQKRVVRFCVGFILAVSVLICAASRLCGPGLVRLFAPGASEVCRLASDGFAVFSYSFLFCGLNIFTSALFTALSNGKWSAVLSFLRTFVLLSGGILLLPRWFGVAGVWLAVPAAEGLMFLLSAASLICSRRRGDW